MIAAMESEARWDAARALAQRLAASGAIEIAAADVDDLQPHIAELLERGVLLEDRGKIRFFHENFLDYVFSRDFAERGSSLLDYVRSGSQDLRLRATIRRVLDYQRAEDRQAFLATAEQLLRASDVRFFIKDVVFSVLEQDDEPAPTLWPVLKGLILDPETVGHEAAWRVVARPQWLDVLDESGEVLRWMASESESERDAAVRLLRSMQTHRQGRVALLVSPFLGLLDWNARLRWLLRFGDVAGERVYFELILRALREGVFDEESGGTYAEMWLAAHDLPSAEPEWAVELLDAYFQQDGRKRLLEAAADRFRSANRDHWSSEFIAQTASAAPRRFAMTVLPVALDVVVNTASEPDADGVRRDPLWGRQTVNERDTGFVDMIYDSLGSALRLVAKTTPRSFRRFERALMPLASYHSVAFLLFRAWAANPRMFWRQAISLLTEDATCLRCGYTDSPYWVTRELINAVQGHADRKALTQLEAALLSFYPSWEQSAAGHTAWGYAQYTLLSGFDQARLTERGRKRLRELATKFDERVERPQGIISGFVGSPIPDESAAKMSDQQWLAAMRKYASDESREFLKGGAVELSRVLERLTQEDPPRFAALALRFPDDTNENYFDGVLRGIGETEHEVDPDDVFKVIRRGFESPSKPGGRWIVRPLARVAEAQVPDDVVDIVAWYATKHPDPEQELAKVQAGSSGVYYGGDLVTAGMNSVRGSAAQALMHLLWDSPERLPRLKPSLKRLVRDPVLAVRACAAWTIAAVANHDLDFGLTLFHELVDTEDELLATDPVEDFVRVAAQPRFDAMRTTIVRMLNSPDRDVQQAGGRQAALAYLGVEDAEDVAELAANGSAPARIGVAQVAASNVANLDVREQCSRWLRSLFVDPEPEVREASARWCMQIEGDDLGKLLDLARAYVETPAHLEHEHGLLHALDDAGDVPIADVALQAAEVFVAQHSSEIGDVRREAILDAPIVSKLIFRAYASAPTAEFRNRCLDVIDLLVAARVRGVEDLVREFDAGRA